MPKVVDPGKLIKELGGSNYWTYIPEKKMLVCRLCNFTASVQRRSVLDMHVKSNRHKKHVKLYEEGEKKTQQTLTLGKTSSNTSDKAFVTDLTMALVTANIPLAKVEREAFVRFLETYTKRKVPSRKALTLCMEKLSKDMLETIKSKLVDQDMFVSIDETSDSIGRPMCVVLAGEQMPLLS